MPIACDPNATYTFCLKADRDKPEPRATFRFRFQTCRQKRQYRELGQLSESQMAELGSEELEKRLYANLAGVLAGWENLVTPGGPEVPFPPAEGACPKPEALQCLLDNVLSEAERWELYYGGIAELDEGDRKNFESRRSTASDGSAPAAAASA